MYSVNRKNCENRDAATSSCATFDVASVRNRKIRIGNSGAFERNSMPTNARTSAVDAASTPIVDAVPQPCCEARVIAYTSSISPAVIEVAMTRSEEHTSELQSHSFISYA